MSHAKLNAEAQKCEDTDKKRQKQEQDQQSNKRKREDQLSNIPRKKQAKTKETCFCKDTKFKTNGGEARLCKLWKAAGAPEQVFKSHWASQCKNKDRYSKLLSGGAGSRQKACNELSASEKKLCCEFKLMVKNVKHLESKQRTKRKRRGENANNSFFTSSLEKGF